MADRNGLAPRTGRLVAMAAVLLASAFVAAAAGEESRQTRLVRDAADGELDEHTLIEAALIASGVEGPSELNQWQSEYAAKVALVELSPSGKLDQRLRDVHAALHQQFLRGRYVASASDLRTTLARGDYNCLTALVIHWDLCSRAGLVLDACAEPGHVHLLLADGMAIEPGVRWAMGWRVSSGSNASRRLTPAELLGKFYYNRGVEQLQARKFAAGIALLETSLKLDPADADARENLAAGFNNWAVEQCRRERYDLAAPLISQGRSVAPAFAPLVANERLVRERLLSE